MLSFLNGKTDIYENTRIKKVTLCAATLYESFDLKSRMLEYRAKCSHFSVTAKINKDGVHTEVWVTKMWIWYTISKCILVEFI